MSKSYRYDPDGDTDSNTTLSRKELKRIKRERKKGKDSVLDDRMKSDDEETSFMDNGPGGWILK